ncbi:MAG TPA: hypothetical protein ENK18_14760, partial [Deltaproteobacteria bacterium]|nr:hypothetical protein [Deltaproteobacteria bacterium]
MSTSWTDFLVRTFTGGANEMTGDNLIRQVVDGIVSLRTRGRRGASHLPSEVEVTITVGGGEGSLGVVSALVEDPSFEEEVSQRLQNRLVELPISAHPMRLYTVVAGRRNRVSVDEVTDPMALELMIEGGDRDGETLVVPTAQRDLRLGRGPSHGSDSEHNDLIVTQRDAFVSRRAARIRRLGGHLRIQALDQGDALAVVRRSGERVRPNRTIERWAPVRPGDVIELNDGAEQSIRLLLRPAPRAGSVRAALTADHLPPEPTGAPADPTPGPASTG